MPGLPLIFGKGALFIVVSLSTLGCRDGTSMAVVLPTALEADNEGLIALKTVEHVPVESLDGDVRSPFFVTARSTQIKQYPCSSCHDSQLPDPAVSEAVHKGMHLDISMAHAPAQTMDCRTCHNGANLDTLLLNDGTPIRFDHSYQLCTQCHFEQGRDWAGGAHGKRLEIWRGKRVIMSCTECHNAHAPQFDKRWPLAFPRIPRDRDTH